MYVFFFFTNDCLCVLCVDGGYILGGEDRSDQLLGPGITQFLATPLVQRFYCTYKHTHMKVWDKLKCIEQLG